MNVRKMKGSNNVVGSATSPLKRRLVIALCLTAGIIALIYISSRILAVSSGFPNLPRFSLAEIYVYDERSPEGRIEPLSANEEEDLREVLFDIKPIGPAVDANDFDEYTGWHGEMFLLSFDDGQAFTVKDTNEHILIKCTSRISKTKAWRANDSSLQALHNLYEDILENHSQE